MVRKLRWWRALFLTALGGVVCSLLGAFQLGKASKSQGASPGSGPTGSHTPTGPLRYDPHWLACPIPGDGDGDLLLDLEELAYGLLDPLDPDQNANRLIDGAEVAYRLERVIDGLPWWNGVDPPPPVISKVDCSQNGLERCEVCGATTNMGFIRIHNPWNGRELDVDFIALHYLRHGSYVYDGTVHDGRLDVTRLLSVLADLHRHAVQVDTDGDLLADPEETLIGFDPLDPDENGDLEADGPDLAAWMGERIAALPEGPLPDRVYKEEHLAFGLENCEVCGEVYNMGFLEITDPVRGLTVNVPMVGMHHLEHGSFTYDGMVHDGRIDVPTLYDILANG